MAKICLKLNCNNPTFSKGYCINHQYLKPKIEKKDNSNKLLLYLKKDSKEYLDIVNNKVKETNVNLDLEQWFIKKRGEMTGFCENCNKKTMKTNDKMYKFSVCHIIPKSKTNGCPSVATHENNWFEGCIDCHTRYDETWEKAMKLNIWEEIKQKASTFINLIPKNEYKKFIDNFKI